MALDTADKRGSSINIGLPFGRVLPIPDGSWGQGDRQQVALSYRGILAGAASLPGPTAGETGICFRPLSNRLEFRPQPGIIDFRPLLGRLEFRPGVEE